MSDDFHLAALSAAAGALASGAGPDGLPSRQARRRAKRILDLAADEGAAEEIIKEVGGATDSE